MSYSFMPGLPWIWPKEAYCLVLIPSYLCLEISSADICKISIVINIFLYSLSTHGLFIATCLPAAWLRSGSWSTLFRHELQGHGDCFYVYLHMYMAHGSLLRGKVTHSTVAGQMLLSCCVFNSQFHRIARSTVNVTNEKMFIIWDWQANIYTTPGICSHQRFGVIVGIELWQVLWRCQVICLILICNINSVLFMYYQILWCTMNVSGHF